MSNTFQRFQSFQPLKSYRLGEEKFSNKADKESSMYNGYKVVDVHGHMTTPAPFRQFLAETVSQNTPGRKLEVTDEQLANAQQRHLKFMDDRNIDIQLIGPRPIAMWHWMRPFLQEYWCRVTNDVIARIVKMHPDRFRGMAQLPQSKEKDTRNCLPEFERCEIETNPEGKCS